MMRTSRLALCGLVLGALVVSGAVAQAQQSAMAIDPGLAKQGKSLFQKKGCNGCHTIGKGRMAGPDLLGVTDRRTGDWLKRWIKAPDLMYDSDSIAKGLIADFAQMAKMPNLHLSDAEVDALVNYLAQESQKKH